MAGYAGRVQRDIARWVQAGLIDAGTGRVLSADIEKNAPSRFSFGAVLALMGGALFAAAILIFIAANWEVIPRLARVGMLFALIVGGYVGGALLKLRGQNAFGEASWIVAAAAFGASIALIAQMYHMSGDEKEAILIWCGATALAAAALRSGPLTVGASLLAGAWMLMHTFRSEWPFGEPFAYLLLVAALYLLSRWTHSRVSRHLLILSTFVFACLLYWEFDDLMVPVVLAGISVGAFASALLLPKDSERILGLGADLLPLALLGFLTGMGLLQSEYVDDPQFLIVSIIVFVGIIAALLIGGRDSVWLRRLAYAAFIFQLGFIYIVMLGSMIGTAGFFVVGGLILLGLAWFITRLERRLSRSSGDAS